MKKALILLLLPSLALADDSLTPSRETAWKQGVTLAATTLAGTMLAGPIGLFFGAAGGGWLGEHIERSGELDATRLQRDQLAREGSRQRQQIEQLEFRLEDMGEALASRLEFQVMFATGVDEPSAAELARLRMLASYLLRNPELHVRLDGYADPRGTDEYNNVLAMYRARNVAATLNEMGVPRSRISVFHHGASMPEGAPQDLDSFALQRRVDIQVFQDGMANSAQSTAAIARDP